MKQEVKIGQTDYTVLVLIRDSITGAPKTGLTNASAGIEVGYTRVETDNDVTWTDGAVVALATPALTDVHLDWGFLEVDATKAPGLYRLDIADGVFVTGAWSAVVSLICTGCDPNHSEFALVSEAPYDGVKANSITDAAIKSTTFTAGAIDAAALASDAGNEIAAALLDLANGIETGITPRSALKLMLSALAGKLSGAATTTVTIRNVGDSKSRIVATVDADGNRSAVTTDVS
jgi:hypothetical protein